MTTLALCPITLREANAFVVQHHRHHGESRGCLFCVAAMYGEAIIGVAIIGRPVARRLQDGWTAEVTRLCVWPVCEVKHDADHPKDGCSHDAASLLYGAGWRAARAIGYRRLVTYTLPEEGGASLRGAGFKLIGQAGGGSWSRKDRPRVDEHPTQTKLRWERSA